MLTPKVGCIRRHHFHLTAARLSIIPSCILYTRYARSLNRLVSGNRTVRCTQRSREPFTVIANLPRQGAPHLTSPRKVASGICRSAITAEDDIFVFNIMTEHMKIAFLALYSSLYHTIMDLSSIFVKILKKFWCRERDLNPHVITDNRF